MSDKLWTIVIDKKTGQAVDAFDQADPVCGGGPELCGGCRDCIVTQCARAEDLDIWYDATNSEMEQLRGKKEVSDAKTDDNEKETIK